MESSDPRHTSGDPPPQSEPDALRRLEERLDRASDAAERLIVEAAQAAARAASEATTPPPAGWQTREQPPEGSAAGRVATDADLLTQVLGALRELIPPELQQRVAQALRELLLALRALLDWYIDRLERRRAEPVEVKDIPIL